MYSKLKNRRITFLILFILYFLIYFLVLMTGGTKNVFPHLMYIPIIFAAFSLEIVGGIFGGIIGGAVMGIIPLDTSTNELQSIKTISIRMLIFITIGIFIGKIFSLLKRQYLNLEELHRKDRVTNLPNRLALMEEIEVLNKSKENRFLIAVHIDNIMEIFSLIGHSKTELILKEIASYFENVLETKTFKLFNSHSLKFEFLLEGYKKKDIEKWFNNFEEYMSINSFKVDYQEIPLQVIMGASKIKYGKKAEVVLNESYRAVEFAKNNSKNFSFYDNSYTRSILTTYLVSEITKAINSDELYLEYQPKLNLLNNRIEEVEALVRWRHPKKGIVPPDEFIPKLEKTYKIKDLTIWVIRRAIEDIKTWEEKGIDLNVSVNVTPTDLKDKNFLIKLFDLLEANNIDSERINIELTETDMIKEMKSIIESILYLREKGVKVSIDDFGTGYSSLSYINTLPIDYVKIDKSFIKNLIDNEKSDSLLENTVTLLHNLDKIIVAEGVEDSRILDRLLELGCEEVQGYFISKPLLKEDLEIFIKKYQ